MTLHRPKYTQNLSDICSTDGSCIVSGKDDYWTKWDDYELFTRWAEQCFHVCKIKALYFAAIVIHILEILRHATNVEIWKYAVVFC